VLLLADVEIAVGTYNKIRMNVTEAEAWYYLEVDEKGDLLNEESIKKVELKVPSDRIDVITRFNITSGENVVVLIDTQPVGVNQQKR